LDTKDASTMPLQACSAVLAQAPVGTPPGNHSVARLFATQMKKVAALQAQEDTWKAASALENSPEATAEDKEAAWKVAEAAFEEASPSLV